ncbi:MAG: DNA cytosine methyltransferase [Alphaproteobacteria bacterium]|nr:DNA cytosine methyltransferase [Alphaproteobacteria bacterium]
MKYLSVCSGIEAATVAWEPLGWRAVAYSEIAKFPSAVLKHHYPDTPNWGDMTKYKEWPDANIDVLVGGTPCQSFSVAGLRKGLADPRGNLALVYLGIAERYRPDWLVWENVPGVLSSTSHDAPDPCPPPPPMDMERDGQAMETEDEYDSEEIHALNAFLAGLSELGYGYALRVFDAQFFGVAQRRRRVFVVGRLGDWRPAHAVLFERESLRGDTATRREAGAGFAGTLEARASTGGSDPGAHGAATGYIQPVGIDGAGEVGHALTASRTATGRLDPDGQTFVAHTLRGEGFDASEDGTGRGTPIVPLAFQSKASASNSMNPSPVTPTLDKGKADGMAVAVSLRGREGGATAELSGDVCPAIRTGGGGGDKPHVLNDMAVRRLTPRECERVQGFPDDYTQIPWRGKDSADCPDGPRYKALGNSMAVPVMRWIGERIELVRDRRPRYGAA